MKDDHQLTPGQLLVKYSAGKLLSHIYSEAPYQMSNDVWFRVLISFLCLYLLDICPGKGNNLHEVEMVNGETVLVSMPKKYRHTVWLKRDDCLVVDPIEEGKKVKGEIVCVLRYDTVRDLIENQKWPGAPDPSEQSTESLLKFFDRNAERKQAREEFDAFPSTDSSDMETDEDEDEKEEDEEEAEGEEDESKIESGEGSENETETEASESPHSGTSDNIDELTRDKNRSRVQLVTSGIVTVTNVMSDGIDNDIQSLEFEADEEESADELASNNRDMQRHANTIRIQVNYNQAS